MAIPTKWTQLFNRLQANIQYLVGKINDIDASGGSVTVDSTLSTTSENPVQNKVVNSALNGKVNTSDYVAYTSSEVQTLWESV